MKLTLRRFLPSVAALACVLAIAAALVPRPDRPAATIADLKTDPFSYIGEVYSNTNLGTQGDFFGIQVENKVGNKFSGITPFSGIEGTVSASGKVSMKTVPLTMMSATTWKHRRGPSSLGEVTEITFKGQLSAGGNAIVGTYKVKGTSTDKGTFFFVLDD